MKRCLAALTAVVLAVGLLAGCGAAAPETVLTLWAGPVGDFADPEAVQPLLDAFTDANPGLGVELVCLSAEEADARLAAAAAGEEAAPDLILDSSDRLLRLFGGGSLADLGALGLWDGAAQAGAEAVSPAVAAACLDGDGVCRVLPLAVGVDCMAVNRSLLEAQGLWDRIGEDRTWTTADFDTVINTLLTNGVYMPGLVFAGGISGDQGSRGLAANLAGLDFTDTRHSRYTFTGDKALEALQRLRSWCAGGRLCYDGAATAFDELTIFAGGGTAMSFCWNAANQAAFADEIAFTPWAVAFPCDGTPALSGTVWGVAIPQGAANAQGAAALARFLCRDAAAAPQAVRLSGQLPADSAWADAWAGDEREADMAQFAALLPYLRDICSLTPGWGAQRLAWRELMLRAVGAGEVEEALNEYTDAVRQAVHS